jgi:hypothetical protein
MAVIDFPIMYIPDPTKGRPLFNGQIFVGIPDLDPEVEINQKQLNVIQEDGTVVPVDQPFLLSAGGVPIYQNQTVRLDVDGNYSLKILDKLGAQTYLIENVFEGQPVTVTEVSVIIDDSNDRLNPATLAIWQADTSASAGDKVTTKERSTGDGGGAAGDVITGTGTANGFEIVAHDTLSLSWVLRPSIPAKLQEYGAKPNTATDQKAAIARAFAVNKYIDIDDVFHLEATEASAGITTQDNTTITGSGSLLGINTEVSITNRVPILTLGKGSKISGVTIGASNTNATRTDNTTLTVIDADPLASFDYNDNLIAISLNGETTVNKCTLKNLWRGFSGKSGSVNLNITNNLTFQISAWHAQIFDCVGVVFSGNSALYGGASGGYAFSSSKNLAITGNYMKVVGTGINPGGSASAGLNVDNATISGNTVIARDCINLENGAENSTVTGNTCRVLKDYNLAGTNGNGVTCTSESAGAFSGSINNISITSNNIDTYDSTASYAFGVRVGSDESTTEDMETFILSKNIIRKAATGMLATNGDLTKKIRDITANGNIIYASSTRGMRFNNVETVEASHNKVISLSSSVLAGNFGIAFKNYVDCTSIDNTFAGWEFNYRLDSPDGAISNVIIKGVISNPHPMTSVKATDIISEDGNETDTRWFLQGKGTNTSSNVKFTLRYTYTKYEPAAPIVTNGLTGLSVFKAGEIIIVEFNGNVTVTHNSPFTELKGGVNVTPAAGAIMAFVCHSDNRLTEFNRDF